MSQTGETLLLRQQDIQAMLDHVRSQPMEEACGLLAGVGNQVTRVIPVENVLHSPYRYRMEPRAQVRALQTIDHSDLSLVGIYHSHPGGPSGLSSQDLREAAYPEAAYLVWSFADHDWQCRAFRLDGGSASEIRIVRMATSGSAEAAHKLSLG